MLYETTQKQLEHVQDNNKIELVKKRKSDYRKADVFRCEWMNGCGTRANCLSMCYLNTCNLLDSCAFVLSLRGIWFLAAAVASAADVLSCYWLFANLIRRFIIATRLSYLFISAKQGELKKKAPAHSKPEHEGAKNNNSLHHCKRLNKGKVTRT